MKNAIKVTGIIWGILCIITALICGIVGLVSLAGLSNPEIISEAASTAGTTVEQAKTALTVAAVGLLIPAVYLIVGAVFSFVLVGIREKELTKGAGIALGVIGAVFGAEAPGILFVVDSAINR